MFNNDNTADDCFEGFWWQSELGDSVRPRNIDANTDNDHVQK